MAKKNKKNNKVEDKTSTSQIKDKDNVKENKETKNVQNNDDVTNNEWLEEELEDLKQNYTVDTETEELMKKAANKIEELNDKIKEWKDSYMRLHAEWDTYRRRINEQRNQEKATATEGLVTDILPVLDDFERSITYASDNGEEGLLDGVKAVYSKLISVLNKSGVEIIEPTDFEAFNALEHQAVATVENKDVYDESIASVMQKGYKMGIKVIRPAMVSVTTDGEKRPKDEKENETLENANEEDK